MSPKKRSLPLKRRLKRYSFPYEKLFLLLKNEGKIPVHKTGTVPVFFIAQTGGEKCRPRRAECAKQGCFNEWRTRMYSATAREAMDGKERRAPLRGANIISRIILCASPERPPLQSDRKDAGNFDCDTDVEKIDLGAANNARNPDSLSIRPGNAWASYALFSKRNG